MKKPERKRNKDGPLKIPLDWKGPLHTACNLCHKKMLSYSKDACCGACMRKRRNSK